MKHHCKWCEGVDRLLPYYPKSAEGQRPKADPDQRGAPSNVEDHATAVRRPFKGRLFG